MRETTKRVATVLCVFAMFALGCGDTETPATPDTSSEVTKEEAAQMKGKSDAGIDLCEFLGWYDDGICDEFCVHPDPDCGPAGCSADSDCASGQVCQSGICEAKPPADCGGRAGLTCGSDEFCSFAPDATCGATDTLGTCALRPEACTQHYDPVCGCDGQTYGNACTANSAGVSVASKGECAQTCAADSDCTADQECVDGTCADLCGGRAGLDCVSDEFCSFAPDATCGATDKLGTCAPRPDACTQQYDPVCGCNGQTYVNACNANAAGVSVESQGECPQACTSDSECVAGYECVDGACEESSTFCGGFGGFTCDPDEWCDYDNAAGTACGAADGGGTCQGRPENCAQVFDPVCGCDGMTYSNECVANAAGTDILATGPCN